MVVLQDEEVGERDGAIEIGIAGEMALNQPKNETTYNRGIAIRRHACGWNNGYLLKVLAA